MKQGCPFFKGGSQVCTTAKGRDWSRSLPGSPLGELPNVVHCCRGADLSSIDALSLSEDKLRPCLKKVLLPAMGCPDGANVFSTLFIPPGCMGHPPVRVRGLKGCMRLLAGLVKGLHLKIDFMTIPLGHGEYVIE